MCEIITGVLLNCSNNNFDILKSTVQDYEHIKEPVTHHNHKLFLLFRKG